MRRRAGDNRAARRVASGAFAFITLVVMSPSPASAQVSCGGQTFISDTGGQAQGDCVGGSSSASFTSSDTSATSPRAIWNAVGCGDRVPWREGAFVTTEFVDATADEPEGWIVFCSLDGGPGFAIDVVLNPDELAAVDPVAVRDRVAALIAVPLPAPASAPDGNEARPTFVQMTTFLWLDQAWEPLSASASEPFVTVSVTATPVIARWDMGDGHVVECDGPGVEWAPGMGEHADCGHTYRVASALEPDNAYTANVSVEWNFDWTLNGVDQGSFGTFEVSTEYPVYVGEILAVEG